MNTQLNYLGLYFLLILFVPKVCFGQASLPDSLRSVYQSEKQTDAARINAIIRLGSSSFINKHPDSLLSYYEDVAQLIQDKGTEKDKVLYVHYQGLAYFKANRYPESINCFQQVEKLAKMEQDTFQIIKALGYIGMSYMNLSDFPKSLENFREALLLSEIIGHQKFVKATHINLGLVYMKYGAYDKSREYLMKALEYDRREGDVVGGMKNLTNIGVSYQEEKKYEKAKEFHLKAYAIAQKKNLRMFMGTILLNIGDCYFNLDDFSKAQSYLSKGVRIAEEENEKMASIRGNIQFARLYQKSKPDSALYFANKGLVLAHQVDDKLMEEKLLRVLYEVHENQGGYREALNSYKRWKTTLDTIYSEKNTRAVFESEARYAAEKQKILDQMTFDKDIAEQKLKSQTKLYLLLGAFASLVAIFVVVLWIRQNSSEKEKTVLLHQIELIKERAATQFISVEGRRKGMKLDKGKLETHLGTALGESSWNILTAIYEKPTISNREIAQQVFLSLEGVSSSLRRMYRSFEVTSGSSKNLKVALVTKAIKISLGELGKDVPLRIGNHKVNRLEELLPGRWKKSETGKI